MTSTLGRRIRTTLALTALVSSLLVFGVSPVSAHGCTTSDHLAVHGDHYDYWDYTDHRVEVDGNHLHYWRNVTHDYNPPPQQLWRRRMRDAALPEARRCCRIGVAGRPLMDR